MKKILIAIFFVCSAGYVNAQSLLNGAGASFPYPVYSSWAYMYKNETGINVNYQSIGSGGGIKQIIAGTVDFGASDDPLPKAELDKSNLIQFPAITGGIVIIVNVDGLKNKKIVLDGKTAADIFMGKITMWNDASIVKLNPNLKLPNTKITVIRRSDSSGTTAVFTKYLSETSLEWAKELGSSKSINWKTGIGAKGNDGVSNMVKKTKNSIGYTEYTYAEQLKLDYANLINKAGKIVEANINTFTKAVETADWHKNPSYAISLTNSSDASAWPIAAASFILLRKDKAEVNKKVMEFFKYGFEKGDAAAQQLKYVPLSKNLKDEILAKVK